MKLFFNLFIFVVTSSMASAADFTMRHGKTSTVFVQGCAQTEVALVSIESAMSGSHKLTSRCLPIICAYSNETDITWFGTTWTIKLLARDKSLDVGGYLSDPQFDRSFDHVLHEGIETKQQRDALIKKYQVDGTCKGVYYDKTQRISL